MVFTKNISEQTSSMYNCSIFNSERIHTILNKISSLRLESNSFSVGDEFIFAGFFEEKVGGYGPFFGCFTKDGGQVRIYPSQLCSRKGGCLDKENLGQENKVVLSGTVNGIEWFINRTERDKVLSIIQSLKPGDVLKCVKADEVLVPPYNKAEGHSDWGAAPNEWRIKIVYSWEIIDGESLPEEDKEE